MTPAWFEDPLEVDRYLDGACEAAEAASRRDDLAARPEIARRLAARRAFLEGLTAAGARWRTEARTRMAPDLESRVRFALRREPASRRWLVAAAAVLVAAFGLSFLGGDADDAAAMPPEVIQAVDAARTTADGPRGCAVREDTGPMQFPPVKDGALRVWRCREDGDRTVAKLYRPEELPSIGYAAVATEGVDRGPDLGQTDLGDMVVYDLVYGRRAHYLAVSKAWLEEVERESPGRSSCRACHNLSREGRPNPHNIVQRSWRLGG